MLSNLINNLKLNSVSKAELDKLLALPEVSAILSREEKSKIDRRKELISNLHQLPNIHKKHIEERGKKAVDSRNLCARLERELRAAKIENSTNEMQSMFADQQMKTKQREIYTELVSGRDLRIDDLYIQFSRQLDLVRNLIDVRFFSQKNGFGTVEIKIYDNTVEVTTAIKEISACMIKLDQLVYSPLSRLQITDELAEMCSGLKDILSDLNLTPPSINEHGEVQEPVIYAGKMTASDLLKPRK